MANRRKYKQSSRVTGYTDSWKIQILHDAGWSDTTIFNLGVNTALGISLEKGAIKSENLSKLDADLEKAEKEIAIKRERIHNVLSGQIKEERNKSKREVEFKKLVTSLIRRDSIEWIEGQPVISNEKLVDLAGNFTESLGIPITPKMIYEEIVSQGAEA